MGAPTLATMRPRPGTAPLRPSRRVIQASRDARRASLRVIPLRNTRHTCSSLLVALKVHPKVAMGRV
ncbi:hypothetical protein [Streptomyces sp. NBC_00009]|uniref:hypothetical protein n=1 Tax=Streptomyces sp. NBC_00009 TaxID=2975620 RepID=UPI003250DF18